MLASPRRRRGAALALVAGGVLATTVLVACDTDDGRALRAAGPDQTATLVNSTTSSAPPDPAVLGSGLPGEGVGEGGLTLRAPWEDEGPIDPRYTCQNPSGAPASGISPALSWSGVPAEATNLALVVTDLSANGFVHWVAVDIDPEATGVEEGRAPAGAVQAENELGTIGWGGPCPPAGTGEHEYLVQLYALDQGLGLTEGFDADTAIESIETASIATVSLVGRYGASVTAGSASTTIPFTTIPSTTSAGPTVTNGPSPT